jgi:hypothetical protein
MKFFCILLAALPAFGQNLFVSSVPAAPGQAATLEVSFANPGQDITALQFDIEVPAQTLETTGTPAPGKLVESSGKMLACRGTWKKAPTTYAFRCVVAGGQNRLGNGTVALVKLQVSPKARPGRYRVVVDRAIGVNARAAKIVLKKAEGAVMVSGREDATSLPGTKPGTVESEARAQGRR